MKAFLILEDGTVFDRNKHWFDKEVISEIVFNTSMTGYLEVLTDPSYAGQAVVMTYPLIGNYGICTEIWSPNSHGRMDISSENYPEFQAISAAREPFRISWKSTIFRESQELIQEH